MRREPFVSLLMVSGRSGLTEVIDSIHGGDGRRQLAQNHLAVILCLHKHIPGDFTDRRLLLTKPPKSLAFFRLTPGRVFIVHCWRVIIAAQVRVYSGTFWGDYCLLSRSLVLIVPCEMVISSRALFICCRRSRPVEAAPFVVVAPDNFMMSVILRGSAPTAVPRLTEQDVTVSFKTSNYIQWERVCDRWRHEYLTSHRGRQQCATLIPVDVFVLQRHTHTISIWVYSKKYLYNEANQNCAVVRKMHIIHAVLIFQPLKTMNSFQTQQDTTLIKPTNTNTHRLFIHTSTILESLLAKIILTLLYLILKGEKFESKLSRRL